MELYPEYILRGKNIQKVQGKTLQLKKGRKIKIYPFWGVYTQKINTGSIQETKINVYVVKIQILYLLKFTGFFFGRGTTLRKDKIRYKS